MLTFYRFGSKKLLPHTKHNHKHTHNKQQSKWAAAAVLSSGFALSMDRAVASPNHHAVALYGSVAGILHWVRNRDGWFTCLGQQCNAHQKNRETGEVLALGGCHFMMQYNNQPIVSVVVSIMTEQRRGRGRAYGGVPWHCFVVVKRAMKKQIIKNRHDLVIECSLIDRISEVGNPMDPLIWLLGQPHLRWEWWAIIPSCPVVTIEFYHAMEVSCYHFFLGG